MHISRQNNVTPPTLEYLTNARDAFVGDPAMELAVLLIDHVRESRQSYLEQTRAEERQLRAVQAAQIEDLREEADKLRDAGVARGTGLIVSGALSIGAGFATASAPSADAPELDKPVTPPPKGTGLPEPVTPPPPKGTDWPAVLNGAASGARGGGELLAALHERQGRLARVHATEHEHLAGESDRRLKTLEEARSHLSNLERSAFEHLRIVRQTEAETDQAAVTWRG